MEWPPLSNQGHAPAQKQNFVTVFSDGGYQTRAWKNTNLKTKNTETMHQSAFFQDLCIHMGWIPVKLHIKDGSWIADRVAGQIRKSMK